MDVLDLIGGVWGGGISLLTGMTAGGGGGTKFLFPTGVIPPQRAGR